MSSPDVDLQTYWPADESCFGFLVELQIGPDNVEGADIFQTMVCTPEWLKSQCAAQGPLWGRHMLIVDIYDYNVIKAHIERYIANSDGDDWEAIAVKLSRIGAWEFEDYQQ